MEGTEPGISREETLTREQQARAEALQTASNVTSSTPSTLQQAVGGVRRGAPTVLPGDLVRIAHWIVTGESVIITDDDTVVMRDDAGWTTISMDEGKIDVPGYEQRREDDGWIGNHAPDWSEAGRKVEEGENLFKQPMEHISEHYRSRMPTPVEFDVTSQVKEEESEHPEEDQRIAELAGDDE